MLYRDEYEARTPSRVYRSSNHIIRMRLKFIPKKKKSTFYSVSIIFQYLMMWQIQIRENYYYFMKSNLKDMVTFSLLKLIIGRILNRLTIHNHLLAALKNILISALKEL